MKSIFTILAAFLLAAVCVSAQNSNAFEKGYRGNVSFTGNVGINTWNARIFPLINFFPLIVDFHEIS